MSIVKESEQFIRDLLQDKLNEDFKYHNLPHTLSVRKAALELGHAAGLEEEELEVLELAALFHDTGFVEQYEEHETASKRIATRFLSRRNYPREKLEKVLACIDITIPDREPGTLLEKIIKDADLSNLGRNNYLDHLKNLRFEWEQFLGRQYTDAEWYKLNEKFIKNHQYYTQVAEQLFGAQSKTNQKLLKKMGKKEKGKEVEKTGIHTSRSAQMMFKTALRNHLDLSNLADNKANIMLSVNALIITIAMPLAATYIADHPYLLVPSIILLVTCLCSMIFATLATRPIRMNGYTDMEKIRRGESNLFFFGNFYSMTFKEYQEGMEHVIADEETLENSIMRDLYFLGRSLGQKYRQLRLCYNIFMVGVILSVLVFGLTYWFH